MSSRFDKSLAIDIICSFIDYFVSVKGISSDVLSVDDEDIEELLDLFLSRFSEFDQEFHAYLKRLGAGLDDVFESDGMVGYFDDVSDCAETYHRPIPKTREQLFPCLTSRKTTSS